MTSKHDNVTRANEEANGSVNGKQPNKSKRPEDGNDVQDVNEAANAEFNDDSQGRLPGTGVGGLRGPSD